MAKQTVDRDVERLRQLVDMFWMDRMLYLAATLAALLVLLVMVVYLFAKGSYGMAVGAFAPAGVIAFSTSNLTRMYTTAFDRLVKAPAAGGGSGA